MGLYPSSRVVEDGLVDPFCKDVPVETVLLSSTSVPLAPPPPSTSSADLEAAGVSPFIASTSSADLEATCVSPFIASTSPTYVEPS